MIRCYFIYMYVMQLVDYHHVNFTKTCLKQERGSRTIAMHCIQVLAQCYKQ